MNEGMFNYSSIVTDVGRQNQMGFGDFHLGDAILYVFTPKILPTQVLRPYQFNFGNELVDELSHYRSIQEAIAPMGGGNKDAINQAVLPRADGYISNCQDINTKYTFILVIDNEPYKFRTLRNCAPTPGNRLIGIGYFTDEPISTFGNSLNPNSVMVFTHFTSTYNTQNMGPMGLQNVTSISHDVDVVSPNTANMYAQPMFLGTPADIMKTVDITTTGECIGNLGDIMIQNQPNGGANPMISNIMKSPRHFLNNIGESLDTAISEVEDSRTNTLRSNVMPPPGINELETSRTYFTEQVQGSSSAMPTNGFNMNRPCTCGELVYHYPHLIVKPLRIPMYSNWSVSPQESITVRNIASSMVASSLQSFCQGCGLTNISFYYQSWNRIDNFSTKKCGMWQIMDSGTMYPCTDEQKAKLIKTFMKQMELSLYPILLSMQGDFSLGVVYNSGGEILIDLLFCDNRGGQVQGEGFYETNSRLGGMINPMLIDNQGLLDNSGQLRTLVDTMFGKKLGPDIFHQGTDQFVTDAIETGYAQDIAEYMRPAIVDAPQAQAPQMSSVPVGSFQMPDFNSVNVI